MSISLVNCLFHVLSFNLWYKYHWLDRRTPLRFFDCGNLAKLTFEDHVECFMAGTREKLQIIEGTVRDDIKFNAIIMTH